MNKYDPTSGSHDNLNEHPIDRCKQAIAEHMDLMLTIYREARDKGATREAQFAIIVSAVKEGIERGNIKAETYIPAMVAYILDI